MLKDRIKPTGYAYIISDGRDIPLIMVSTHFLFPLNQMMWEMIIYHLRPEDMYYLRPELSLMHIHAGLVYYFDHPDFREHVARKVRRMGYYITYYGDSTSHLEMRGTGETNQPAVSVIGEKIMRPAIDLRIPKSFPTKTV